MIGGRVIEVIKWSIQKWISILKIAIQNKSIVAHSITLAYLKDQASSKGSFCPKKTVKFPHLRLSCFKYLWLMLQTLGFNIKPCFNQ